MFGDNYSLANGFWINDKGTLFDLGLNENIIATDCINFSYVANAIIVTKRKNTITIFSTNPVVENGISTANVLAKIENSNHNIFAKVVLNNTCYVIDYNCQVTANVIHHNLHPKIN